MNENNNVATVEEKKKKGMNTGAVIGISVLAAVTGFVAGKMTQKSKAVAVNDFEDSFDEYWDVVDDEDEDEEVNPE